jgi:hypothetical protein
MARITQDWEIPNHGSEIADRAKREAPERGREVQPLTTRNTRKHFEQKENEGN